MGDYSDRSSLSFASFAAAPYRLPARAADIARWRFDRDIQTIISPYARAGETINVWPDEVGGVAGLGLTNLLGSPASPSSNIAPQGFLDMTPSGRMGLATGGTSVICRVQPGTVVGSPVALPAALRAVSQTIRAIITIPARRSLSGSSQLTDSGMLTGVSHIWQIGGYPGGGVEAANLWSHLYWSISSTRTALVHLHRYGAGSTVAAQYWLGLGPSPGTHYIALTRDDIGGGLCRYRLCFNGQHLASRGVSVSNVSLETATFAVPTGGDGGDYGSLRLGNQSPAYWNQSNGAILWHDLAIGPAMTDDDLTDDYQASRLVS
jgi:hypothetical protein